MALRLFRLAALLGATAFAMAAAAATPTKIGTLTPQEQAQHALNRLAFGPRPGDVDLVLSVGLSAWIEQQLHPSRIPDVLIQAELAKLPTLAMSNAELMARFDAPVREAKKKIRAEKAAGGDADADPGPVADDPARLRDLVPPESRPKRILEELTAARILRAASSERQLNEVLVDFWMNHFNVYASKGEDRVFIGSFERDTIRPRIWGSFEDLLLATARSPAMLFYLDNARSVADAEHRPPGPAKFGRAGGARGPKGLNENYARELMELHTLGVDGGYTQTDVTELARILTGWSIGTERGVREAGMIRAVRRMPGPVEEPGGFVFHAPMHDAGEKTFLGRRFRAGGGIEEGEAAIRMLARHPATARHIAFELCRRLVADEPPVFLVERVTQRYLATGGDLTETVRAVVVSAEFFDPQYYQAKIKSPFEYAVSAIRAVGGMTDGRAVSKQIAEMGEPLYLCQPPTGYADTSQAWVSSGTLLARMNFALALTGGRIPGTVADRAILAANPNLSTDIGGPEFQRQ